MKDDIDRLMTAMMICIDCNCLRSLIILKTRRTLKILITLKADIDERDELSLPVRLELRVINSTALIVTITASTRFIGSFMNLRKPIEKSFKDRSMKKQPEKTMLQMLQKSSCA